MTLTPGTHTLGPTTADLLLHTSVEGRLAKLGHSLTLIVEDWQAEVVVGENPESSSLQVAARLGSLRVRAGRGGAKPVSDKDRGDIEKNAVAALEVERFPELTFVSTGASGSWEGGRIEGTLGLHGQSQPQAFDVEAVGDGFRLSGEIVQSRFGIKVFSTMMGALKLGDAVAVEVTVDRV